MTDGITLPRYHDKSIPRMDLTWAWTKPNHQHRLTQYFKENKVI